MGIISQRTFRFGFSLPSVDQKNIHSNFLSATCVPEKPLILSLVFLGVGNFDARYFFGSKISGLCIFLGLQYEAPSDPPVRHTSSTPPGPIRLVPGAIAAQWCHTVSQVVIAILQVFQGAFRINPIPKIRQGFQNSTPSA